MSSSNSPEGATVVFHFSESCLHSQTLGGSRSHSQGQSKGVARLSDLLCHLPPFFPLEPDLLMFEVKQQISSIPCLGSHHNENYASVEAVTPPFRFIPSN